MMKSLRLLICLSGAAGLGENYLGGIPRTKLCSSETKPTGSLEDDLSRLRGDGDACIYRINTVKSENNRTEFIDFFKKRNRF